MACPQALKYFIWPPERVNTSDAVYMFMADDWEASLLYTPRSYRISIPAEIVRENGWRKGDKLALSYSGGVVLVGSKRKTAEDKTTAYSIGYEGKSLEGFISVLKRNDVHQLVDVRKNAFSFKSGFSRTPLSQELGKNGIAYVHIPELGTDQESRREYKESGDISKLLEAFKSKLEQNQDSLNLLKALIHYRTSAIMCLEDNYELCHRSVIEERLQRENIGVVHLCNGRQNEFF